MKRYIAIDIEAMHDNNLSPLDWILLENIYFLSNNETGYCYASKKSLSEYLGVSNGKIYNMINELLGSGYIIKHNTTGHIKTTEKWLKVSSGDSLQNMENKSPKNGKSTIKKEKEEKRGEHTHKKSGFSRPTIEEVKAYGTERCPLVDSEYFFEFFNESDWIDTKGNKVRNWKQKMLTWQKGEDERAPRDNKALSDLRKKHVGKTIIVDGKQYSIGFDEIVNVYSLRDKLSPDQQLKAIQDLERSQS